MKNDNGYDDDNIIPLPSRTPEVRGDEGAAEPAINLPPVTKWLCAILIAVTVVQEFVSGETADWLMMTFGFVPARYNGDVPLEAAALAAPVTYMFLHGGWLHLLTNVGMLMAFGAGLERAVGPRRFLAIYFFSGIVGAAAQYAVSPDFAMPLVGASGGVSGLFGAMVLVLHRWGQLGTGTGRLLPVIVMWIAFSVFFGFFGMPGAGGQIAWVPHVAGFLAGMGACRWGVRHA